MRTGTNTALTGAALAPCPLRGRTAPTVRRADRAHQPSAGGPSARGGRAKRTAVPATPAARSRNPTALTGAAPPDLAPGRAKSAVSGGERPREASTASVLEHRQHRDDLPAARQGTGHGTGLAGRDADRAATPADRCGRRCRRGQDRGRVRPDENRGYRVRRRPRGSAGSCLPCTPADPIRIGSRDRRAKRGGNTSIMTRP
jgi:hypothetical protein